MTYFIFVKFTNPCIGYELVYLMDHRIHLGSRLNVWESGSDDALLNNSRSSLSGTVQTVSLEVARGVHYLHPSLLFHRKCCCRMCSRERICKFMELLAIGFDCWSREAVSCITRIEVPLPLLSPISISDYLHRIGSSEGS